MATLLVKNAAVLVTMDDGRRELRDGALFARDGVIEAVGTTAELPTSADDVIDAHDCVVTPGLINTHHHLFQSLLRAVPGGQDAALFGWLKTLYPLFLRMGPEDFRVSAMTGLAELALSGCTCSSDHQYIFPNGARLDDAIGGARAVGIRFTATRGAMSIGESQGGLPPDKLTERESDILKDCARVIAAFHDAKPHAMVQIALAPCSPFTVSEGLMRDTAMLARDKGVRLHTHLAENGEDVTYSLARYGKRPGQYAEDLGWTGDDVWHAHCVQLDAHEIGLFARTGTGVAHCPCSNMRLASGIAPIRRMRDAGVPVGLGVDGSASSDSGHMLNEARQAMLLQRVGGDPAAMSAREALELATRGGARVLGRADIGHLAPGMAADLCVFPLDTIEMAGADWDPVAALMFCGPIKPKHVVVGGKRVVSDYRLTTLDLPRHIADHRRLARRLAS
jgi:cytosine/adenosine deaminase-related metal-dependent hydrolase